MCMYSIFIYIYLLTDSNNVVSWFEENEFQLFYTGKVGQGREVASIETIKIIYILR